MKSWIVSADFSRAGRINESSPLLTSLKLNKEKNYLIFSHNQSHAVEPFLDSIEIPLYMNPMAPSARIFRKCLRLIKGERLRTSVLKLFPNQSGLMIPHNLRHFYYKKILSELPDDDFVFLVDSRDLIFQKSSESIAQELADSADLHFFDEGDVYFKNGKKQRIKDSPTTLYWLNLVSFNHEDFVTPLEDEMILNGGCFAGRVKSMRKYNLAVCEVIEKSNYKYDEILDQVATIIPAYSKTFREFSCYHINGKLVLNMCGIAKGKFQLVDGKCFMDGELIPIVHQYDRFGEYNEFNGISFSKRPYQVYHSSNQQDD